MAVPIAREDRGACGGVHEHFVHLHAIDPYETFYYFVPKSGQPQAGKPAAGLHQPALLSE